MKSKQKKHAEMSNVTNEELTTDEELQSEEEDEIHQMINESDIEEEEENPQDDDDSSDDDDANIKKVQEFSLHELSQMRAKVPQRKVNSWVYGQKATPSSSRKKNIKRANKNRPLEMSMSALKAKKKKEARAATKEKVEEIKVWDPRFRPEIRGHVTKAMENLVEEKKTEQLKRLQSLYQKEENPEQRKKLKMLIKRIKDQLAAKHQEREKEEEKKKSIQRNVEALRAGKRPFFQKKAKRKEEPDTKKKTIIHRESKLMKKEQFGVAFLKRNKK